MVLWTRSASRYHPMVRPPSRDPSNPRYLETSNWKRLVVTWSDAHRPDPGDGSQLCPRVSTKRFIENWGKDHLEKKSQLRDTLDVTFVVEEARILRLTEWWRDQRKVKVDPARAVPGCCPTESRLPQRPQT